MVLAATVADVEAISPVPPWARDPEWLVRSYLGIVRFEAVDPIELPALVINPLGRFRKCDATDSGWALKALSLRFDVHDSGAHEGCYRSHCNNARPLLILEVVKGRRYWKLVFGGLALTNM